MKAIQNKTKRMLQIEKEFDSKIEELLRYMYVDLNLPARTISNKLDISYATTLDWLSQSGVYSRDLNI